MHDSRKGDNLESTHILISEQEQSVIERKWWKTSYGIVILFCVVANFINSADRVIMPIAIGNIAEEFDYSLVQQGWILSSFPAGYISSQIVSSCACSQLGGRFLLFFVVLLWSISTLLVPVVASSYHLLIFARVVLGLGEGLGIPTMYHVLAQVVPLQKRSVAFSFLAAGGAVGQTLAAAVCPHLKWEYPFYALGVFGLYWCILWAKTDMHLQPPTDHHLLFQKMRNPLRWWNRFVTLPPLIAIYFAHFCMNWNAYIIMHWLPTYLRVAFHADNMAVTLAALPYFVNSLCGIATGYLVDDLVNTKKVTLLRARIYVTVLGLIIPALLLIAFAFVKNLFLAVLLISLSMGALAMNSAGHLSNHADVAPKYAGITFAISNTIATLPGLTVGPLTAHLVVESSGRWWPAFILAAVLNFTGAAVYATYAAVKQVI
uniref:Major facilitator superfamily (MFS) profile domain-containing protein n=1 Tax=Setaria digitata TaxID=48799 RepID=A0A915PWW6_9BILA